MLTSLARCAYGAVFNTVFRRMDAEKAHGIGAKVISTIGELGVVQRLAYRYCQPERSLRVHAMGLEFPSPFGLAAGFDKDAELIDGLTALGFGHVEVGTVTPRAQPGNPKPRMYRLPADRGLINRMGFNNGGATAAAENIAARKTRDAIVGVNIGKNKDTAAENAVNDYVTAAQTVLDYADYLVINVSSPNTPGLRGLQELDALEPILRETKAVTGDTPLLVKIAPDLEEDAIRKICGLAEQVGLAGVVATNTTIARSPLSTSKRVVEAYGAGGLSGKPVADRSLAVLKVVRDVLPEHMCVISVGGVTSHHDVQDRLAAGATLVQGYTAFLYEGPLWAASINRGLTAPKYNGKTRLDAKVAKAAAKK
ncbi:quinone-dependent dihydroorotate dehydrogenase [Gulosibacter chungangensis]|uniref:Dihydroorotate dehydrogenase (quinone) n=1 Tax=Gulosibacter chungangensis TaxID=979746 RepID=A0A7J5BEB9_9MICO|nr:quinone-dependent dihydroorotate dehydrogenase [Gulosibacter chungangensis]KAB1643994.1 quinone-dependent dihydroorotate dehydrogenase [Gulosibacter chungangensis]